MSDVSAGMYNACLMLPASLSLLLHLLHLLHIFTFSTFTTYLRFPHIAFLRPTQNILFHCRNQIPRTVVVWRNLLKGLLIRENNKLR